jgi:cob(I)alamin adenosyltransferase
VRVWTGRGDDGTTGLLYGGRVRKDAPRIEATGAVDEAQAALGAARAEAERGSELDVMLVGIERDLWVLMAELATASENRPKLEPGRTSVSAEMLQRLEDTASAVAAGYALPSEFVVPGQNRMAALLDVSRTVVRRAERAALAVAAEGSLVVPYLNRLSSVVWAMARWQEGEALPTRTGGRD